MEFSPRTRLGKITHWPSRDAALPIAGTVVAICAAILLVLGTPVGKMFFTNSGNSSVSNSSEKVTLGAKIKNSELVGGNISSSEISKEQKTIDKRTSKEDLAVENDPLSAMNTFTSIAGISPNSDEESEQPRFESTTTTTITQGVSPTTTIPISTTTTTTLPAQQPVVNATSSWTPGDPVVNVKATLGRQEGLYISQSSIMWDSDSAPKTATYAAPVSCSAGSIGITNRYENAGVHQITGVFTISRCSDGAVVNTQVRKLEARTTVAPSELPTASIPNPSVTITTRD